MQGSELAPIDILYTTTVVYLKCRTQNHMAVLSPVCMYPLSSQTALPSCHILCIIPDKQVFSVNSSQLTQG